MSMWSLGWHFTNKSVTGAPYSIKSYSLSHSWTLWCRVRWLKHAVPSWGRGGTAAAMAQNEQTTEEHSTLEQQSPISLDHPAWCVVWTVYHMTSVDVEASNELLLFVCFRSRRWARGWTWAVTMWAWRRCQSKTPTATATYRKSATTAGRGDVATVCSNTHVSTTISNRRPPPLKVAHMSRSTLTHYLRQVSRLFEVKWRHRIFGHDTIAILWVYTT